MFVVALTGGIGCGKSEATNIFAELGVPIVDLDIISHQLTTANQSLIQMIAASFGKEFISAEGTLNRSAMRQLVFSNSAARAKLNAILHPAIYDEAIKQLQQYANAPYVILAIPLLNEDTPYKAHIHRILVIDCEEKIQIARVKLRSQLSEPEIMQIIHAQISPQDRLRYADDVIENNETVAKLRRKILHLHEKYINTCIVSKTIS
ncbi:MAG: dephospho-CoA kinase [Methylophilaceae bacterium]